MTRPSIASLRPSSVHPGPQHKAELAFDPSGCLSHLISASMVTLGAHTGGTFTAVALAFSSLALLLLGLRLKMPSHPFHDACSTLS